MQKYGEEIKATTKGKNDYHAFVLSCFVSATPVALLVRLQRHKLVGSTELSLQGLVLATQRIHNILAPCNIELLLDELSSEALCRRHGLGGSVLQLFRCTAGNFLYSRSSPASEVPTPPSPCGPWPPPPPPTRTGVMLKPPLKEKSGKMMSTQMHAP